MKKNHDTKGTIFIVLAFLIMGILFYSSSMTYQEQNVQPFLYKFLEGEPLVGIFEKVRFSYAGSEVSVAASGYLGFIEFFLRKGAHFSIFLLLGVSWFMGLRNKTTSYFLTAMLALLLAAGYASFDELRQSFNPERTALLEDVFIDSMGALTGILITWLLTARWKGSRFKYKKLKFK
ncbi:VanZ family protein [Marinilactibacillus kalidii]|uniref:VanZ family protein n=1 Tax=Marinilactibacillus kalidii TaxID=2820274 RepID=UPI001ABDE613|nr:VanZ family protein [Marinilactibacillus kalidii]